MEIPPAAFGAQRQPLLIVISGPSGVGKDSLVKGLQARGLPLHFVVTVNTRDKREGEKEGVDYFFITRAEFERMRAAGELLEHTKVYNDYKGVPRAHVREAMKSGKDVLMRLDVQGAATIRGVAKEAVLIFITTTSEEEWVARLKERNTESGADLETRINTAREEFARIEEFDYVVVNREGKLEQAIDDVVAIIETEHNRVDHRVVKL